jgi:hypothetical protein
LSYPEHSCQQPSTSSNSRVILASLATDNTPKVEPHIMSIQFACVATQYIKDCLLRLRLAGPPPTRIGENLNIDDVFCFEFFISSWSWQHLLINNMGSGKGYLNESELHNM